MIKSNHMHWVNMKQNPTLRVSVLLTSLLSLLLTSPLSYADKSPIITGPVVGVAPIIKAGIKLTAEGPYIQQELNGIADRKILMPGSIIELPVKSGDLDYYTYFDRDTDRDSLKPEITWYIASAKDETVIDWAPFGTEVTELTEQMIANQDDIILEEIDPQYVLDNGLKLKIPPTAIGKRIAVAITPRSSTGFPIKGKPLFLADLNYTYEQTFENLNKPTIDSIRANVIGQNPNNGGDYVMDLPSIVGFSWFVDNDPINRIARISGKYYFKASQLGFNYPLSPLFDDYTQWSWAIDNDPNYDCGECENWVGEIDLQTPGSSGILPPIILTYTDEVPQPIITIKTRNRYGIYGESYRYDAGSLLKPIPTSQGVKTTASELSSINQFSVNPNNQVAFSNSVTFRLDELLIDSQEALNQGLSRSNNIINYTMYAIPAIELDTNNLIELDLAENRVLCEGQYELTDISMRLNELTCSVPEADLGKTIVLKLEEEYLDTKQNSKIMLSVFKSLDTVSKD